MPKRFALLEFQLLFCANTTVPSLPVAAPLSGKLGAPIELLGSDLTGWTWVQRPAKAGTTQPAMVKMEDVFSIKDGILHDVGNPIGYMRTDAEYDNYVLTVGTAACGERGMGGAVCDQAGRTWCGRTVWSAKGRTGRRRICGGLPNFRS